MVEFFESSMTLRDKAIQTALVGDWSEAVNTNKELLDDNPKDIDALNRLALAQTFLGKLKSAKMTYQKVLKIDPLNPIALRNLKNLKGTKKISVNTSPLALGNQFIEEPGKTKVVELVNIAQSTVIQTLANGLKVNLVIKRSRIFVLKGEKQYIGVLPDDIGRRLIKFMKSGNEYEAYLKSVNPHKVIVFVREVKRTSRYKNQPSFLSLAPTDSGIFDRSRIAVRKADSELEDDEEVEEDEEL